MNRSSRYSRRAFLGGLGLSGALLPLLHIEQAQAAQTPKRLVIISWPNGVWRPEYWPKVTDGASNLIGDLGMSTKPLEPFKSDLLFLAGLDIECFLGVKRKSDGVLTDVGFGHDVYPSTWTGMPMKQYDINYVYQAGGQSIDQYISEQLVARGIKTAIPNLVIGAKTQAGFGCVSFNKDGGGISPENDPVRLFDRLFQSRGSSTGAGGGLDPVFAERKSILDYLQKDLESFRTRLPSEDRQKVEAHFEQIRDLEKIFSGDAPVSQSCSDPSTLGKSPTGVDFKANDNHPALVQAQLDLIFTALKCDLTRVITYSVTDTGGSDVVFSWLGADYTGKGDEFPIRTHHDIAHNGARGDAYTQRWVGVNKWYMTMTAGLVKKLKATPELKANGTPGSMLDNTAVVITNMTSSNHYVRGVPMVIAGSCGGYFKTGQFLRFGDFANTPGEFWHGNGIPHNPLLASLCNAMDCPVPSWGDPRYPGLLAGVRA